MRTSGGTQVIEHQARPHDGTPRRNVDFTCRHVHGTIHHDRARYGLPGQGRPRAPGQHGQILCGAPTHGGFHIRGMHGFHDRQRLHLVRRGIGGPEHAFLPGRAHSSRERLLQLDERRVRHRQLGQRRHPIMSMTRNAT